MKEFKYVVVQPEGGQEQIFIFPKSVNHDDFADIVSNIKEGDGRNWTRPYRKPISAGFTDGERCYGHSETLGLESRQVDTALLRESYVPVHAPATPIEWQPDSVDPELVRLALQQVQFRNNPGGFDTVPRELVSASRYAIEKLQSCITKLKRSQS